MSSITSRKDELQANLDKLIRKREVPGASLAVLDGEEVLELATGVTNVNTGVEATTDTVFQIGSITKIYTTTLVMQLVDRGEVDLDQPVKEYLPEFRLRDQEAADSITARQLLTHTSGMTDDQFEDFGRGDTAVEKYVESLAHLPQLHRPGELHSYCNSGFVLAGRLVEKLTGQTWDAALKDMLLDPLGLAHTMTLPEEAILHRAAIGHLSDPQNPESGILRRAPAWHFSRAGGPAGVISATARDVISFARMHLDEGRAPDGEEILSAGSVEAMQQPQVDVAAGIFPGLEALCLGWMLLDWGGHRVIGHDGATIGQYAFLRISPERKFAAALLTNGGNAAGLYKDLYGELFAGVGIEFPADPETTDLESLGLKLSNYAGTYERMGYELTVEVADGKLTLSSKTSRPLAGLFPEYEEVPMKPVDAATFIVHPPTRFGEQVPATFLNFEEGCPQWLYMLGRAHRRTSR